MSNMLLTVLMLSLSGSLLTLVLFVLKPLLKNRVSKAFSYYIWLLVLLRLVLPFGYGVNLSGFMPLENGEAGNIISESNGGQSTAPGLQAAPIQPAAMPDNEDTNGISSNDINDLTPTNDTPADATGSFNLFGLLKDNSMLLWLTGVFVSICWYSFAYASFTRRIYRFSTTPHEDDIAVFKQIRGNSKNVRLICSSHVNTPMLIGVIKPVIVLPQLAYTANGMGTELRNILKHELMHYYRHDTAYKWFVVLINSAHWFNPFVYLVSREITRACELSCDEAVIRDMTDGQRQSYGNTLLALAAKKRLPGGVMATTMCEEKRQLKGRLIHIMSYKKKSNWAIALMLALTLLLTGCASVYTAFEHSNNESGSNLENNDDISGGIPEEADIGNPYKDILDLYYQALYEHQTYPEQWQPDKYYAEHNLVSSIVGPYWSWGNTDGILAKEGFAFLDLNEDGVDELVIGWIGNEFWNMDDGYVFAIYTIVDGEVVLAVEGWDRCRYVIGADGYLYCNSSGGSTETTYIKYRFSLEEEDFLEPVEEVYSQGNAYGEWWEHITKPDDIGTIEYSGQHEELVIDEEEALAIGDGWMESGTAINYTLFEQSAAPYLP